MQIQDAASIVLVDKRDGAPRILMGRRAAKHKFMPNIYVFPGGRVDTTDRFAPFEADYESDTLELLMQQMRGRKTHLRARMMGLAAIRETYEEVGIRIGRSTHEAGTCKQSGWTEFVASGMKPDLSRLTYIARAITPPGQNRRYDTRFFLVDISDYLEHQTPHSSDELEDVKWVTFDESNNLPLHFITKRVLLSAADALNHVDFGKKALNVAFYRAKAGTKSTAKILTYLQPGSESLAPVEIEIPKT